MLGLDSIPQSKISVYTALQRSCFTFPNPLTYTILTFDDPAEKTLESILRKRKKCLKVHLCFS